jgi:site-specific DNA recombinase
MKAILLARVSSKEQEEGQSIPAQERRLREYAERKGLTVDQVFKITESSTKDTRKEFEKILIDIRKSKETIALVADTIDRVQRSFKESVVLEELRKQGKVEIHFMREGLVLNLKSNSADILRWDMGVMFARSYVLQLSDNVKRSKEQAVKNGSWIGLAPLGYIHVLDEQGEKNIIPDPERACHIVKLFELYATGNYSLLKLTEEAAKVGFRTKKEKKIAKSQIDSILKNPFYCGMMRTKYGLAEHYYKPLISTSLYQQVQDVAAGYHKKPHKKISEPFILRGMIICAHCGCTVTPEIHKKRYIYYSCTNAKGICKKVYTREEPLVESLSQYFDHIALSEEQIAEVTTYLKKIHESESLFHTESLTALRKEQDKIQKRINQMYDDKLDGLIDEKMYLNKVKDYKSRQVEIAEQMVRHEKADHNFYVTANMVMNLGARAREIFESSEVDEKRQLLNFVFQNLKLDSKNLSIDTCEPFTTLVDYKKSPKGWGKLDLNQRPAGYEGGGLRVYPVPSNLNQLDDSLFWYEKSTGFCWLVPVQYVKRCTVFAP